MPPLPPRLERLQQTASSYISPERFMSGSGVKGPSSCYCVGCVIATGAFYLTRSANSTSQPAQPTQPVNLREARRLSLIRVCQPSPLARRAAITSASSRSLTGSLGETDLGRPRALSLLPSCRSADLKNAAVKSGASYGSLQVVDVERFFAVICFPQTDDAAQLAARCPYHHNQLVV
jgi:hypothetical protein